MSVYYIVTKNGQKYYYNNGKRISAEEGKRLKASKSQKSSRRKSQKSSRRKSQKSSRRKSLVPCKSHQYRDPITNRCRNKSSKKSSPKKPAKKTPTKKPAKKTPTKKPTKKSPPKKTSRSRKSFAPCKSHQYRDPITNRCRNKSSKKSSPKKPAKKSPPKKTSRSRKSLEPCKSHQYRDPITNRCRNKETYKRDRQRSEKVPCKPHQYRDAVTGRCKNKSGHKRERSRVREPAPRTPKSGRWKRIQKIASDCIKRSNLTLRDLQIKVVQYMDDHDGLLVVHGTGCGKCHGIDTPILMYDGTIKMVQDIKDGDNLMGIDSKPRKVLSLARGQEEMYKIVQTGGGKDYVVNESHILTLKLSHPKGLCHTTNRGVDYIVANYFNKNNYKRSSKWFKIGERSVSQVRQDAEKFLETVEIDDIIDIPLRDYMKLSKANQHLLKGFRVSVEFPSKEVPLDPYFIGLWLGDGCSRNPAITTKDTEVIEYLNTEFSDYSVCTTQDSLTKHLVSEYIPGQNRKNNVRTSLQKLDLIQNKHIPEIYLKNSRENRLKLLAGLIDSDGWYRTGGCYEIVQKSKQLTDDIEYLLRSLGARVTVKEVQKGCNYQGEYKQGLYNRISFSVDFDIPVLIERKKGKPNPNKDLLRNGIKVQSLGIGDYYGFELDGNHRYLLGDFTATHNTLTAVTATQCYLDKYPDRGVVFVGPTSLISNFQKEMRSYGIENDNRYDFYSYDKFMLEDKAGRPISTENKFLVVDEAHNLRNSSSKKSQAVVKASFKADKRLLLTATPFVNSLSDFIPLINMIYGKMKVGTRKEFYSNEVDEWLGSVINDESLATFRYLLEDKVDMVDCKDPKDFPERIDHYVDVPMTVDYYKRYAKLVKGENLFDILFSNPEKFYNGYRRAVNKAGTEYYSSKVETALPILKKGHVIIYTNWVDFGINPIVTALKKNDISYKAFYGDIPTEDRQGIIDAFNKDKFKVLILTKAGGEGIDLKGVRSVVVLDPTWNDAGLQQIIGRAIRYKSHAHLPLKDRNVNVYLMSLVTPDPAPIVTNVSSLVPSGDKLLYEIIEKKNEISAILLALLEELSI